MDRKVYLVNAHNDSSQSSEGHFKYAATEADIEAGITLLIVSYAGFRRFDSVVVEEGFEISPYFGAPCLVMKSGTRLSLASAGVSPYNDGTWSRTTVAIIDNDRNRARLALWLINRKDPVSSVVANSVARQLCDGDPNAYIRRVTISGGSESVKL